MEKNLSWEFLVSSQCYNREVYMRVNESGKWEGYAFPQIMAPLYEGNHIPFVRCSWHEDMWFEDSSEEFQSLFRCEDCQHLVVAASPDVNFRGISFPFEVREIEVT